MPNNEYIIKLSPTASKIASGNIIVKKDTSLEGLANNGGNLERV